MVTLGHHEWSECDEERLSELFQTLDLNKDGRIDIVDLRTAFQRLKIPHVPGHAERFIEKYDTDHDGHLNFSDFVNFARDHEQHLRISFSKLDKNRDGYIDLEEIIQSFRELGVNVSERDAELMLHRMDKDKTLLINWMEWRDYLMFHPTGDIHDIYHYWRHVTFLDAGEDVAVPDDFTEAELELGIWWKHLLAGGVAGAVSRTFTAPLDRLKVILQVYGSKYRHTLKTCWNYMVQEGGIRSCWRGNGINVMKIAPETAMKFMAYEQIKRYFKKGKTRDLTILERFASGSLAGAIAQSSIYPMEVVKTRMALRTTGQYSGIVDCASHVLQREGLRSFYRGYMTNLLGIIPYAGIELTTYETVKHWYNQRHPDSGEPGVFVLLACGAISSTCGQLASYPLALVRTRLQANSKLGHNDTMVKQFKIIIKQDGFRGLYRGLTPNFMKVIPAVSISYAIYEQARKVLHIKMT